jgi:hypothetical protein
MMLQFSADARVQSERAYLLNLEFDCEYPFHSILIEGTDSGYLFVMISRKGIVKKIRLLWQ